MIRILVKISFTGKLIVKQQIKLAIFSLSVAFQMNCFLGISREIFSKRSQALKIVDISLLQSASLTLPNLSLQFICKSTEEKSFDFN